MGDQVATRRYYRGTTGGNANDEQTFMHR